MRSIKWNPMMGNGLRRIATAALLLLLFALVGSAAVSGQERDREKKKSERSAEKKEPVEREKKPVESRNEPVERRREPVEGRKEPVENRKEPVRPPADSRETERAIKIKRWSPQPSGRDSRTRDDETDARDQGRKEKKDNPGWSKRITKGDDEERDRIPVRPGRIPPPPPREYDDEIIIWPPPPPPIIPPPYIVPIRPPGGVVDYPGGVIDYYDGGDIYEIHLPCGIIRPEEVEPAFLERIEYLLSIGRGDDYIVCLFQTREPLTNEETNELFENGVTFYRFLTPYTAIVDAVAEDIPRLLMESPKFRWIGEYKAEYKYSPAPPESSRRGAYVQTLFGDSAEFRTDMEHLGIAVVAYYEDTEDYYIVADWEQFHSIAELWWVEKIFKEAETFSTL